MDNSDEIFRLTKYCASLFADCQSISALTKDDWIGERLVDFNLWAAGIRASTTGHSSLDYRIRERPDVKSVLVGLLSTVRESAEGCLHKGESSSQTSKDGMKSP
jgi:hypothetical protein